MRVNAHRAGRSCPLPGLSGAVVRRGLFRRPPCACLVGELGGAAVYGLSLAIYCTSWTFYGAVGRAATSGIDFILIYIGPVLLAAAIVGTILIVILILWLLGDLTPGHV
jgi:hypothetical protein